MMYLVLKAVMERFYEPTNVSISELIPYHIYLSLKNPTIPEIQNLLTKSAAEFMAAKT